jgi:uncharacterized flavoprotein (TIGR03862 family)
MGVTVAWTAPFLDRFAGAPLKAAAFTFGRTRFRGEAVIARYGLEGGAIYALSRPLREEIDRAGRATLWLDLAPDLRDTELLARLSRARANETTTNRLRKAGLTPEAIGLLREAHGPQLPADPAALARAAKGAPLTITGFQGLDRAISSAGGIALTELDADLQLRRLPGVYACGEMLDWEAPTGGYLLQACFATGLAAARGALASAAPSR